MCHGECNQCKAKCFLENYLLNGCPRAVTTTWEIAEDLENICIFAPIQIGRRKKMFYSEDQDKSIDFRSDIFSATDGPWFVICHQGFSTD